MEGRRDSCKSFALFCMVSHQASRGFLSACLGTHFLSLCNVIPCRISAVGTATVGTKIHGNDAIVEVLNPGLVIRPRVTALTRSAMPRTVHTITAYFDQL